MLITAPPPERIRAGMPWRQPRKVPKRSSLMTRQNSSTGASTTVLSCGVEPPALLWSTSRRPKVSSVVRIAVWRLASSVTSVLMAIAPWPARCAVSSPATTAMSATATRAPSCANSTAVARPIPAAAPVMKATFPASRVMDLAPRYEVREWGSLHLAPGVAPNPERVLINVVETQDALDAEAREAGRDPDTVEMWWWPDANIAASRREANRGDQDVAGGGGQPPLALHDGGQAHPAEAARQDQDPRRALRVRRPCAAG